MSRLRTALRPRGQSLTFPMFVSVMLHGGALVGAVLVRGLWAVLIMLFPWCAVEPEPILPDSVEVALISLPKSETDMPDRAARARRPPKAPDKPAPVVEPPPKRVSEVVHRTKTPPPRPGVKEADDERADALAELRRQDALAELDAPEGPVDRNPSSPDGEGDEVIGNAVGAMGDPALARWHAQIRALYQDKFNPISTRSDLRATAIVVFDPNTGLVLSSQLTERSGVAVFDAAAERALAQIRKLPALPPGKSGNSVTFIFEP